MPVSIRASIRSTCAVVSFDTGSSPIMSASIFLRTSRYNSSVLYSRSPDATGCSKRRTKSLTTFATVTVELVTTVSPLALLHSSARCLAQVFVSAMNDFRFGLRVAVSVTWSSQSHLPAPSGPSCVGTAAQRHGHPSWLPTCFFCSRILPEADPNGGTP